MTALGAAAYALLLTEAAVARRIVGRPVSEDGPPSDGIYGEAHAEPGSEPISMVVLGDSTSVGLGMTDPKDTPASTSPWAWRPWPSARCG